MLAVSLYLPELYRRLVHNPRVPESLDGLFCEVANLLEQLKSDLASAEDLTQGSSRLKGQLVDLAEAIGPELTASASREATLSALTGGMFAGALDGTLLYGHNLKSSQPELNGSSEETLERSWQILWRNLAQVLEVGQSSWSQAHVDDLQLLSSYGKHENRNSLAEGEAMEEQTRNDRNGFRTFLLASFKGGYAMGVADAAVMFVGGERPDALAAD